MLTFIKKEDRAFWGMLAFVAVLLAAGSWSQDKNTDEIPTELSESSRIETSRSLESLDEEFAKRLAAGDKRPAVMGLGLALLFFAGLFTFVLILLQWRRGMPRPANLASPPWELKDVIRFLVVLFFAEGLLSLAVHGFRSWHGDGLLSQSEILMAATLARNGAALAFLWMYGFRRYGVSWANYGFVPQRFKSDFFKGVMAYTAVFPIFVLVTLTVVQAVKALGWEAPVQTVVQIIYKEDNWVRMIGFALVVSLLGPIFEEIFFRGFIYRIFRQRWGLVKGLVGSAVLFSLLHVHGVAFIPVAVLGIGLALTFEVTQSLVPGIVFHACHNLVSLGIMFFIKAYG